eukprot:scaffold6701_cov171-Alexandrium_tamarense.AAC.1
MQREDLPCYGVREHLYILMMRVACSMQSSKCEARFTASLCHVQDDVHVGSVKSHVGGFTVV